MSNFVHVSRDGKVGTDLRNFEEIESMEFGASDELQDSRLVAPSTMNGDAGEGMDSACIIHSVKWHIISPTSSSQKFKHLVSLSFFFQLIKFISKPCQTQNIIYIT